MARRHTPPLREGVRAVWSRGPAISTCRWVNALRSAFTAIHRARGSSPHGTGFSRSEKSAVLPRGYRVPRSVHPPVGCPAPARSDWSRAIGVGATRCTTRTLMSEDGRSGVVLVGPGAFAARGAISVFVVSGVANALACLASARRS